MIEPWGTPNNISFQEINDVYLFLFASFYTTVSCVLTSMLIKWTEYELTFAMISSRGKQSKALGE